MARDAGVEAWLTLPRRLYLDTGPLQTMDDYGETLWKNEPFEPLHRDYEVQAWPTRAMLCATSSWSKNERFEFAVTEASLREVAARNEPGYTQWVDDVLDS